MSDKENKKDLTSKLGKKIGIAEKMACGCLNLGCLLIIFFILAVVALLVKVVTFDFNFSDVVDLFAYIWEKGVGIVLKVVKGE